MVLEKTKSKSSLEKEMSSVIIKEYTVERRIFKDGRFFKGYFANMNAQWGEWEPVYSYTKLEHAHKMQQVLETGKPFKTFKVEYRLIKENK